MPEPDAKTETRTYDGGCSCGWVRYRVTGRPIWTANCHCRSCRRSTGAAMASYAGYLKDNFTFLSDDPATYNPSPFVARTFCARCGTSLTYQGDRWPGEIHIHVGSLDDPEQFAPEGDAFEEQRLSWLHLAKPD
ncbi:MAG: GFA family protein [Sphingomonadales bacterium]